MMSLKHDGCARIEDQYIGGIKRLTAISKSYANAAGNEKRDPNESDIGARHVCLACGYMWNVNPKKRDGPKKCPSCVSMHWNNVDLKRHVCKQCSHKWMSSVKGPIMCPGCKSKLWNKDTEKIVCKDCGNIWVHKLERGIPERCTSCRSDNISYKAVKCKCNSCGYSGKIDPLCASACPVCKAPVLFFNGSLGHIKERETNCTGHKNSYPGTDGNPAIAEILGSVVDDTKKIIELTNRCNMEFLNAEVLVRYHSGEDVVSIARNTDASLDAVFMMTLPFSAGTVE